MPKIVYHDSEGVEKSVELGTEPLLIGRATECQIQTQDGLVSRRHARIVYDGSYWIEDTGSANGVYIGTERVQRAQLRPGDEAQCGSLALRFQADVPRSHRTQGMIAVSEPIPGWQAPPSTQSPPSVIVGSQTTQPPPRPEQQPPFQQQPASTYSAPPQQPMVEPPNLAVQEALGQERLARQGAERERDEARRERDGLRRERDDARRKLDEVQRDWDDARRKLDDLGVRLTALRPVEDERDRLKARVSDLEGQLARAAAAAPPAAAAAPAGSGDAQAEVQRLLRKIEQLESEKRRLRGGGAVADPVPVPGAAAGAGPANDGRIVELEGKLRRAEQERDDAVRRAAAQPAPSSASRSMLMQPAASTPELERALAQLRNLERERDGLSAALASGRFKPPARVSECLTAADDHLAALRISLAAGEYDNAQEQLGQARGQIREVLTLLGLSV